MRDLAGVEGTPVSPVSAEGHFLCGGVSLASRRFATIGVAESGPQRKEAPLNAPVVQTSALETLAGFEDDELMALVLDPPAGEVAWDGPAIAREAARALHPEGTAYLGPHMAEWLAEEEERWQS